MSHFYLPSIQTDLSGAPFTLRRLNISGLCRLFAVVRIRWGHSRDVYVKLMQLTLSTSKGFQDHLIRRLFTCGSPGESDYLS